MDMNSIIKHLVGDVAGFDLSTYDSYGRDKFGVLIPIFEDAEGESINHKHPSYEIIINFDMDSDKPKHYWAEITSPNVLHNKNQSMHCYSLFISSCSIFSNISSGMAQSNARSILFAFCAFFRQAASLQT